jgi:hypothetical protein
MKELCEENSDCSVVLTGLDQNDREYASQNAYQKKSL